jgi:hypothetical protein
MTLERYESRNLNGKESATLRGHDLSIADATKKLHLMILCCNLQWIVVIDICFYLYDLPKMTK